MSGATAAALTARGIEPVIEPLISIRFADDGTELLAPLLDGAQAVLFTSANGVRAFAAATDAARPSRLRGRRRHGRGGARGGLRRCRERRRRRRRSRGAGAASASSPRAARSSTPTASAVAGDLAGALAEAGFTLRRAVLYEAVPAERISDATAALIASGEVELALFFSPRTAAHFVRLAVAAGLDGACRKMSAVALSPAVAARLEPLAWRAVHVAEAPTLTALLAAADRAAAERAAPHGSGGGSMTDAQIQSPAPQPRRRAAYVWLAALLVVIAIIGTAPYWVPYMPWAQDSAAPQLAQLQQRLDTAEAGRRSAEERLAQLAARPATPVRPDTGALDVLTRRLDALEQRRAIELQPLTQSMARNNARLDALEQHEGGAAGAPPDAAALDALAKRIDALEQRPAPGATAGADLQPLADALQKTSARLDAIEAQLKTAAAAPPPDTSDLARLAALGGLQAALGAGAPYQDQLALVTSLGGGEAAQALARDAATGLPSRAQLALQFRTETAPAIRRAAAPASAAGDGSLGERTLARIEGLVTIRRVGGGAAASGDPVAAAAAALDAGDLAAAVAALKPLAGAASRGGAAVPRAGPAPARGRRRIGGVRARHRRPPRPARREPLMRALPVLVVMALVIAVALIVADLQGSVAVTWQGWEIETSISVLAAATLVAAIVAAAVFNLLRLVLRGPRSWAKSRRERRRRNGYRALTQGMVAVAAGDAEEAQKLARKADTLLAEPPLTLLLSAQAAQLSGDETAAARYFTAMLDRAETEFLGLRGLIIQALRGGDEATALRLTERAKTLRPKTPWVLSHLLELQARASRWAGAEATLLEATRRKAIPAGESKHRHAALLHAHAIEADATGRATDAMRLESKALSLAPGFAPVAVRYARMLSLRGQKRRARRALEAAWRAAPHPDLAEAYGALHADLAPLQRIKQVERLAALNPDHVESKLALAQASLAAELWGEARRHLTAAQAGGGDGATPRLCRLMAEIEEREHGDHAAARSWLARAGSSATPDPAWVCDTCGSAAPEWSALCPSCRSFATLAWRAADRPPATKRSALPMVQAQ